MFNFIKTEISHFKNLSKKAQILLISFFFYSTAYPIISIFISAFIWKKNSNISSLIFFRIGQFIIVPLAFLFGGIILKILKIKLSYFIGTIFIAISSVFVIFFKNETIVNFLIIGMLTGFGTGLYWMNRNLLTMKETNDGNRNYFFGLLFSFATLIGLVVTLCVGWLIVLGMSYESLMITAFILIIISGAIIFKMDFETPSIGRLLVDNSSYIWMKKRLIHLGIGLVEGLSYVVPGLLILTVLGNEGILGTLTAVSSIISTALIYLYGRKSHSKDHKKYFIYSAILSLFISTLLAGSFNKVTVIIYSLLQGLTASFIWLTLATPLLRNIDMEVGHMEGKRFSYILDSEFYLNGGRTIALVTCLIIAYNFSTEYSLRFSPFFLSCFQVFLFIYLEKFRKKTI